ncbi:uncharacterized protein LOC135585615 isoform X3 [Musa acuminata AAA Group]|uniref:uncharacterized protein LOC135585615 isoform X3 n=1 Tax=Musa acuminata AAA Group TaxID=214697 RepID=UPI0031CFBA46
MTVSPDLPSRPFSLVSRTQRNADVKDRAESFPSEPRLPPRRIHRRKDRNGAHQPHLLPKDRHHRHRNRQPSGKIRAGVTGVIDSLYGVVKPIRILKKSLQVASAGKLGPGKIEYLITADVMRGYLHKSLSAALEFIVENDRANLITSPQLLEFVSFYITQDTQKHQLLPELLTGCFRVTGKILTQCSLKDPITGDLTVEASAVPIDSVDIQLLRVESILSGERFVTDTSVIQTTQIADGDICRSLTLPIYVLLPRLLVCPTLFAGSFSIEFHVSITVSFQSQLSKQYRKSDLRTPRPWMAMVTIPLKVY